MASIPHRTYRAAILVVVFSLGAVFGKLVTPLLFRIHRVMVIYGSVSLGCQGEMGYGEVWLNSFASTGDGSYRIACGERSHVAYNVDLLCKCEANPTQKP